MRTSSAGIALIKKHEGFSPTAYKDPIGKDTIGYGTLIDSAHEQHLLTATISKDEATELLKRDLEIFEDAINETINVPLTQNQFDALASWTYNFGPGRIRQNPSTTLVRKINMGAPTSEIQYEFRRWIHAGGSVLPGLVKRRNDEAELWADPIDPGKKKVLITVLAVVAVLAVSVVAYKYVNRG